MTAKILAWIFGILAAAGLAFLIVTLVKKHNEKKAAEEAAGKTPTTTAPTTSTPRTVAEVVAVNNAATARTMASYSN